MSTHPFFKDQLIRPEPVPQPDLASLHAQQLPPLPPILETSKPIISPVVGFAVGVAGLAAAAVAYYQLAQFVARKNAEPPPAAVTATAPAADGSSALESSPSSPPSTTATGTTPPAAGSQATARTDARQQAGAGQRTANAAPRQAAAPAAAPVIPAGALSIDSPVNFQVYVGGELQGVSGDGRISIPAGTRSVTLVNNLLEFRQTMPVNVQPGQSFRLAVPLPTGSLSVNALPWADVFVDGAPVGTTPLAHLALPIGSHEVVWRHPTLGERRQTVVVKAQTPVRIGVDFNR